MFRVLRTKQVREGLTAAALAAAALALIAAPQQAMAGAGEGLALCFNVILPSLFPFFVLSSLVVDLGMAAHLGRALDRVMRPLFRVGGGCGAALAMGFVGGYPVGARTALQLYRQGGCTKTEAERLLAFCNNSGPAFIFGVVGAGVYGSGTVGLLLYLTHAAASLLVGLLFRFYGGRETIPPKTARAAPIQAVRLSAAFTGAVTGAMGATLNICAFVLFFSVALRLLAVFGILDGAAALLSLFGIGGEWARRLVAGLLELSSGVASLSGAGVGSVSMAAFMLGWAGLSVHCQVLSFLGDSGLNVRTYLAGKLCHGLIAAVLTALVIKAFPLAEPVSVYLSEQADSIASLDFTTALAVSLGSAAGLFALWLVLAGKNSGKKGRRRL